MQLFSFKKNLIKLGLFVVFTSIIITPFSYTVFGATTDEREAQLKRELEQIEKEQAEWQKTLDAQKNQTATIQKDVNVLTGQIKQAELNIKKKKIEIERLNSEIGTRNKTVSELEKKLERSKQSLSELVRQNYDLNRTSLVEVLLSHDNLSDFFASLDAYNNVQSELEVLFKEIREIIGVTENEKEQLLSKQNKELDVKKEIESQKNTVAVKKAEKDGLLSVSKQSEAEYAKVLAEKKAKAASIRAALFQLRDAQGIEFGDAVKYAQAASKATGVRTAFILGILKQESNIGQNVGSCVITDLKSGQTKGVTSGTIFANGIHPTRDLPILQTILKELGKDPLTTRVSCPFSIGYGGAMGPSQFIPSTWNAYIPRLQTTLGAYPNPWNPEHAIMATAIYMKDLGAAAGGYTAERTAALKYYAGGNWALPQNAFYGNSVMQHATTFQGSIDFLDEVDN